MTGFVRRLCRRIVNVGRLVILFKNWPYVLSFALGLVGNSDSVCTLRNGTRFRVFAVGDPILIYTIWSRRVWTPQGYEIKPGYTVVDIGAHIGAFSIMAATRAQGVRVVSYEPDPRTFALLVENVRLNGLDNVEPFSTGVAGRIEKRKLFTTTLGAGSSLIQPTSDLSSQTAEDVNCTTLTEVVRHVGKCDLLKMNCEGAEYEILLNTSEDTLKNVGRIVMDCHQIHGYGVGDLKSYLERAGFEVRALGVRRLPHVYLYAVRRAS